MRLKEKVVRTPSVYSMSDAEVFGTFFWCCVDDTRESFAEVLDEKALDEFEKSFFSWSYVRNDQYIGQRPCDNNDYVAYLLFWVDENYDTPGYVFQVVAEGEGLRCTLYKTSVSGEYGHVTTIYNKICNWNLSSYDVDLLFATNDDKDKE